MSTNNSTIASVDTVLPTSRGGRRAPTSRPLSAIVAGVVAILIGYSGPALVIFAAARAGGLGPAQTASWIAAAAITSGVIGIALSLWTRVPIVIAWSTPGAALLVTSLGHYRFSDVIGAYLVSAVAMTFVAATGLFDRLMLRIPAPIVAAMLAGILFEFVAGAFSSIARSPWVPIAVIAMYLLVNRWSTRWAVPAALLSGLLVSAALGQLHGGPLTLRLAAPVFTVPTFGIGSIVGIALPLFIVTLTAQNAAGLGVLRSFGYSEENGYRLGARRLVTATGIGSIVGAFFGSHAINLAAITAAICAGPGAHPDPRRRWVAGVSAGLTYLFFGAIGATLIGVFSALPAVLIAAIAGVALLSAFGSAITSAVTEPVTRAAAVVCFGVSASGLTIATIGAPFWGLVAGLIVHLLTSAPRKAAESDG